MKKNHKGFGAVELIMLLVIVGLIGFIGYYVQHAKSSADKNLATATNTSTKAAAKASTADPYAGWKQYCSAREKACFKYPADWKVITSVPPAPDPVTASSSDSIEINSPHGSLVSFQSPFTGLSNSCESTTGPHIFINKVLPLPKVASLYIAETGLQNKTDKLVVLDSADGKPPKTGDTGQCSSPNTFVSKQDSSKNVIFQLGDPAPNEFGTALLILKSYSY